MITKRKVLLALACLGVPSLLAALLLPALPRPSNCGLNSYALAACRQVLIYVQAATPINSSAIELKMLDPFDQTNLLRVVDSHWTRGATYWVRTNGLQSGIQRQVVVVCDTVYDNVPQPTVWNFYRRNPAHAAGFSDGTTGLISPAEFAGLDRKDFANPIALLTPDKP